MLGIENAFFLLFILIFGHLLADYPLQGEFLALGKNRHKPLPGTPWYQPLLAHAGIHGGFVAIITGSLWLGLAEFSIHALIDDSKCSKRLTYNQDQALHVLCKVVWTILIVTFPQLATA